MDSDVIVLDILLPVDGYEFFEKSKNDVNLKIFRNCCLNLPRREGTAGARLYC